MTVRQLWNRILALGLAALPLSLALWTVMGWMYSAHAMLSRETAATYANLRRHETLLAREHDIESAVSQARYRTRNLYWTGATEADATESLQTQLRTVIDAAGGEVQSVEPIEAARDDQHPAVNLRVTLHATATELLETLYSLESYRPYLFLDHLYVRVLQDRSRAAKASDTVLQASLDVRGYVDTTSATARDQQ